MIYIIKCSRFETNLFQNSHPSLNIGTCYKKNLYILHYTHRILVDKSLNFFYYELNL